MKPATALIAVFCIAVAAMVGGCGGSDDDTIAKAEYVKQGNAICAKAVADRNVAVQAAVKKEEAGPGKPDEAFSEELVIDVALPPLTQMTDELAALSDPDPGADEAAAIVGSFETGIEEVEDDPARVVKGTVDPFKDAKEQAAKFGLKACSNV